MNHNTYASNTPKKNTSLGVLLGGVALAVTTMLPCAQAVEDIEKENLKFGFIKLTDMVPLAIAYE
ncbi:MAG: hypothetical protein ACRERU_01690, partial [Methylococcales bacterium]